METYGDGVDAEVGRALQIQAKALMACPHVQSKVLIATFRQEFLRKHRFANAFVGYPTLKLVRAEYWCHCGPVAASFGSCVRA